ncbi:photosynthetic reaction center cytochrome PufC [Sulfitobacter sp. LCG007]
MLPKWFSDWNRQRPVDIYGPAVVVGIVGGAVIVAALLVSWGQPFATDSLQTGPRGTGMSVTKYRSDLTTPDPTIEAFYTEEPYVPEGGEPLARDVYQNVQVLGDLTEDNFNRLMLAITQWVSPDQGCAYCHGDGDLETYNEDTLYTKVVSRRMIQMNQNINENHDGHVNANKTVGVTCYTCHRGENVPSGIWFESTPTVKYMAGWSSNQNRVTPVSQYTSLPSDALQVYLAEEGNIKVHDLESRVAGIPGQDDYPGIQHAERTFSLMNYFSNSLGVNCLLCHNSRAFYDPGQVTPQWATALLGISMVQELNIEYLVPLKDNYPPERLGPIHGDAPKLACNTCHKGQQQPLQGLNVIDNYPELATTGAPEYE